MNDEAEQIRPTVEQQGRLLVEQLRQQVEADAAARGVTERWRIDAAMFRVLEMEQARVEAERASVLAQAKEQYRAAQQRYELEGPHRPPSAAFDRDTVSPQREFFSTGRTAAECRREAFRASAAKLSDRKRQVLKLLWDAGRHGLTRFEIAERLGMGQNSITAAVKQSLMEGRTVELPRKRVSNAGGRGAVIVLTEFAEGITDAN